MGVGLTFIQLRGIQLPDLQKLQSNKDQRFRIQEILKYKTEKGKRYGLVKWVGYDDSENTWKSVEELQRIDGSDRRVADLKGGGG